MLTLTLMYLFDYKSRGYSPFAQKKHVKNKEKQKKKV